MSIINKAHCKKLALKFEESRFPNYPKLRRTRVSGEFLVRCETALYEFIRSFVTEQPRNGKTI